MSYCLAGKKYGIDAFDLSAMWFSYPIDMDWIFFAVCCGRVSSLRGDSQQISPLAIKVASTQLAKQEGTRDLRRFEEPDVCQDASAPSASCVAHQFLSTVGCLVAASEEQKQRIL
eukprot:s144_g17.t1